VNAVQLQAERVGSTFIQIAMDGHKEIRSIDEVFVKIARKPGMKKSGHIPFVKVKHDAEDFIRNVIWEDRGDKKHVIFKLMYNQIIFHKGLYEFIRDEKLPIIHVKRKNLVKQIISGKTASRSGHNYIDITAFDMLEMVIKADGIRKIWSNKFKDHNVLEIWYEDLFGDRVDKKQYMNEDVNKKICDFFGVNNEPMYADTKKKNKDDVWAYIKDKDKILKMFKNTEYEWMVL
jgi:hypothetical protein